MKLAAMPKQFLLALSQCSVYSGTAPTACRVSGSQDLFVLPCRYREPAQILLLSEVVVRAVVRTVLRSTVVHGGGGQGRVLSTLLLALVQLPKGSPELLGHEVVDDGVDGAVQVDAQAAEEEEPGVQVRRVHKGVHHHQGAVRQP